MRDGEMRTRDIAEHIGLVVSRTRELLGMMLKLWVAIRIEDIGLNNLSKFV